MESVYVRADLSSWHSYSAYVTTDTLIVVPFGLAILLTSASILGFPVLPWIFQRFRRVRKRVTSAFAIMTEYEPRPAGLVNSCIYCYQNSVIQGLASLPSLREHLRRTTAENPSLSHNTNTAALLKIIDTLNDGENHGRTLRVSPVLNSMAREQQDAQEYYSLLQEALDNESKGKVVGEAPSRFAGLPTIAQHSETDPSPLEGLLGQRVACTTCGYSEGIITVPFNCITVPLGRGACFDLRDCLDEAFKLEFVDAAEVKCEKCSLDKRRQGLLDKVSKLSERRSNLTPQEQNLLQIYKDRVSMIDEVLKEGKLSEKVLKKCGVNKKDWVSRTKSKQSPVARAPKSLVLHINRSIFDGGMAPIKNRAAVTYPNILDLAPWCLGTKPSETREPDEFAQDALSKSPNESMVGGHDNPSGSSPFRYALRAVLQHVGYSHHSGHYICHRRHRLDIEKIKAELARKTKESRQYEATQQTEEAQRLEESQHTENEQWWELNDELVSQVSEGDALSQSDVFMLFYERLGTDEIVAESAQPPLPEANHAPVSDCLPCSDAHEPCTLAGATALLFLSENSVRLPPYTPLADVADDGIFDYDAHSIPIPEDNEFDFPSPCTVSLAPPQSSLVRASEDAPETRAAFTPHMDKSGHDEKRRRISHHQPLNNDTDMNIYPALSHPQPLTTDTDVDPALSHHQPLNTDTNIDPTLSKPFFISQKERDLDTWLAKEGWGIGDRALTPSSSTSTSTLMTGSFASEAWNGMDMTPGSSPGSTPGWEKKHQRDDVSEGEEEIPGGSGGDGGMDGRSKKRIASAR